MLNRLLRTNSPVREGNCELAGAGSRGDHRALLGTVRAKCKADLAQSKQKCVV